MPTLLIDIGGTVLVRENGGPYGRAVRAIGEAGTELDAEQRRTLAVAILAGNSIEMAVEEAARMLRLTSAVERGVRSALMLPDGPADVVPGSLELLNVAAEAGWDVVAVTNAAAWTDPLPPQISTRVSNEVRSGDIGHIKQAPEFWQQLESNGWASVSDAIVVGDSHAADVLTPRTHGFCSIESDGGSVDHARVSTWIRTAATPSEDVLGVAAGEACSWGGRSVLDAPHLTKLVSSVTRRRVRVQAPYGARPFTTVVSRRHQSTPALTVEPKMTEGIFWLGDVSDRRHSRMPEDLGVALAGRGLSIEHLSDREKRHLISLVKEASDPPTRRLRIDNVVKFLEPDGGEPS